MIHEFLNNSLTKIANEQMIAEQNQQNVQQAGDVQVNNQGQQGMAPGQQQMAPPAQMANPAELAQEALSMIIQGVNILGPIFQQLGMQTMLPTNTGGVQIPAAPPPQPMVQTPPQAQAQAPAMSVPVTQPIQESPQQNTI